METSEKSNFLNDLYGKLALAEAELKVGKVSDVDDTITDTRKQYGSPINEVEISKINAVYDKLPEEEQRSAAKASMHTMWEAVKNDSWWKSMS